MQETTSDFYQVPITGGIPVKLTFEKRPFTPPFAQVIKMQACQPASRGNSRQKASRGSKRGSMHASPAKAAEESKGPIVDAYDSKGPSEE